jgi:hypothetical protein
VLGLFLFVVSAAGGLPLLQLTVAEPSWRYALGTVALAVMLCGGWLMMRVSQIKLDVEQYNFKIIHPQNGQPVEVSDQHFDVRGTYDKKPPDGYSIEIIEFDPAKKDNYRPRRPAVLEDEKNLRARRIWGGDQDGAERTIGVALVGKSGKALFDYFEKVGKVYKYKDRPGLDALTEDIHLLHQIRIAMRVPQTRV